MCLSNAEVYAQKFGYQRAEYYTGLTDEQKSLNQFDLAVYTPTNWRPTQYEVLRSKFPAFIRYGGLVPVAPEWFQRNYLGIYPIKQQPIVDEPKPYNTARFS